MTNGNRDKEKLVKPDSQMDDETLVKHINARHMPMAGMSELRTGARSPEVVKALRAYHRRIHKGETEDGGRRINHRHRGQS